jgi:hypothetical protein
MPWAQKQLLMMMMSNKKMQAAEELYGELSGRVEGPPSAAKAAADQPEPERSGGSCRLHG